MTHHMEASNAATMAYPLGHEKGTEVLLKAVRALRHKESEQRNGACTAAVEVDDVPSPEDTQTITDRYVSGGSESVNMPSSKAFMRTEISPSATEALSTQSSIGQEAVTQIYDDMSTPRAPTHPTIPSFQFSNTTNSIYQTHTLTMHRRKPLPRLSQTELTTFIENQPPTYRPASAPPLRSVSSIDDIDEPIQREGAVVSQQCLPLDQPSSRTSTMSSLVSAKSHMEPGPIHIRPSSQLQSMQSISELDSRLHDAASRRRPWRMSWPDRTNTLAACAPTGTPESISNVPLSAGVYEAHSRFSSNVLSQSTDGVNIQDWARSSEWVEPCATEEGSKEWIEDFLARQEKANRDEDSEKRRLGKHDSKYGSIRSLGNSTDKFRRKLSMKRVASERGSFEARQERRDGRIFDLDIGSSPYGRAVVPIPGEHLERPTGSRAFSWNPTTDQRLRPQTVASNRSSWTPTPSASHITHPPERLHMSLPSRWSSYHATYGSSAMRPYRPHLSQQPRAAKRGYHAHARTRSWEKLKVKAVSSIGSEVKRSISTSVVPAITGGKDNVKNLVGKVERAGESMTRKLSASLRGKWKGLGRNKRSLNVEGIHVIGRER